MSSPFRAAMVGSASRRWMQGAVTRRCAQRPSTLSLRPFSNKSILLRQDDGPWADPITKPLNRYVIVAEDYKDPGALARRLEVRDRHLEQAARGKETGRIELGGGLLNRDFKDIDEERGPASALAGSLFVVHAESVEEARQRFNRDEYVKAGVFDPQTIKIFPFLRAVHQKSVEVGHEAVGETKPVSTRPPRGTSTVKPSLHLRREVYVKDPRGSGKTINLEDQRMAESTLSHLRKKQSTQAPATPSPVTLDGLRKNSTLAPASQ